MHTRVAPDKEQHGECRSDTPPPSPLATGQCCHRTHPPDGVSGPFCPKSADLSSDSESPISANPGDLCAPGPHCPLGPGIITDF